MPEVTSKWYDELDNSIYKQVGTHEEAKRRLTGEAKLVDDAPDRGLDEATKDRLTGSAKFRDGEKK